MKKLLEKTGMTLTGAAVSLISPDYVSAHIIDERPGLGRGMTIILSVFWIAVVIGIVIFVRRLMRPRRDINQTDKEQRNND